MKEAISILKSEHRSISAVLHALKELGRMAHDATARPRFQVLRSMVRYIDEYPEKLHHPKEDEHLFARLLARAPESRVLVEALQAEHEEGARLIRELERALLFMEEGWPVGAREFRKAVDAYAEFHWKHMRKEEQELLPLAEPDRIGRQTDDAREQLLEVALLHAGDRVAIGGEGGVDRLPVFRREMALGERWQGV